MIQWAAVMTHCLSIRTPPHQWPTFPAWGWVNRSDTCQGHSPGIDELPPTMRSVSGESLLYKLYPHSVSPVFNTIVPFVLITRFDKLKPGIQFTIMWSSFFVIISSSCVKNMTNVTGDQMCLWSIVFSTRRVSFQTPFTVVSVVVCSVCVWDVWKFASAGCCWIGFTGSWCCCLQKRFPVMREEWEALEHTSRRENITKKKRG